MNSNKTVALRISCCNIVGNILLAILKLAAGLLSHSAALVSDSVHSLADVLSTFIVLLGVKLAAEESDKEHPYGHERFECVAAIILSAIILATGLGIGLVGIQRLIAADPAALLTPGIPALVIALVSIAAKEFMYRYTRLAARRIGSDVLLADAWHNRCDALSSVGSFAGILGARLGFPRLDSAACVLICLFIVKAAADIFRDAIAKMTDRACDDGLLLQIQEVILTDDSVMEIDQLKSRLFGDRIYLDVEISVDGALPLYQAHQIAHSIHDTIEDQFPKIKHCMIHVNPHIHKLSL